MAGNHNFIIEKGESWSTTIAASDADGSHIDHTGYTVEMDIRDSYDSASELLALTAGNGRVSITGGGDIGLTVASSDTSSLSFDRGIYDLKVTSPGGTTSFYLRGNVIVQKSVTR